MTENGKVIEAEVVGNDTELNEYGRQDSEVLLILGADFVVTSGVRQFSITPYGCDNCGHVFADSTKEKDVVHCPQCGTEFEGEADREMYYDESATYFFEQLEGN